MNTTFKHDASQDVPGSSRKSATVLSLALSVAASGLVFHQHDDRAAAAELLTPLSSISDSRPDQSEVHTFSVLHSVDLAQPSRPVAAKSVVRSLKHIVREGETLWSISRRYGVSAKQLADANSLSTDSVLRIGQALELPPDASGISGPALEESSKRVNSLEPQVSRNLAHLQIQTIAVSQDAPVETELGTNGQPSEIVDGYSDVRTQAVARLRMRREQLQASLSSIRSVPLSTSDVSEDVSAFQSPFTVARASSSDDPDIADDLRIPSSASEGEAQVIVYQIERGDTLMAIANKHGISLQSLINENSISNPNRVFVGQTIRIPVSPSTASKPEDADAQDTPVRLSGMTSEGVLVGTLPQDRFGTSESSLSLYSAPVLPLPVVLSEENVDELNESISADGVGSSGDVDTSDAIEVTVSNRELADSLDSTDIARAHVESSSSIYVQDLITSIEEISRPESLAAEEVILDELERISQDNVLDNTLYRPDGQYIETGDAVNPEFEDDSNSSPASDESGSSASIPEETEQLVAVAPLGSENYSSLSQPVTGRMVSPDLPPLPGIENYIPSGEATFNGYLWPARGTLTSGYGWRWGRMHQGIDIAAPVGTPVYAAAPGVVEFSGWNSGGYGNMVDIRHPDGSKTRYAHNSRNLVRVGQAVTQGQQIAEMGSTGYSTGPHVHFEIHKPERGAVNPVAYLPQR